MPETAAALDEKENSEGMDELLAATAWTRPQA
jgi:hypothetical protein